jgi:hypothetical protein
MYKSSIAAVIFAFASFAVRAQETDTSASSGADFYLSAGLSISNSYNNTFAYSSYPSIEAGFMKNNFSLGLVAGRSSLSDFRNDDVSNYWYELKAAIYFPIGKFSGYGLAGIGNYISTERIFIEYGAGFSYGFGSFGTFVQASNWDGVWYVTPGVSYTF